MTSRHHLLEPLPGEARGRRSSTDNSRCGLSPSQHKSDCPAGSQHMLLEPTPGGNLPRCQRYDALPPSPFSWTREELSSASRLMKGTRFVQYRAVYDNDRLPGSSSGRSLLGVQMQSITAMPFYETRSFEELRLEDTRPHHSCSVLDRVVSSSSLSKIVVLGSASARSGKKVTLPPMDKSNDERSCVICLDNRRSIAFFPCKHMCACPPCSRNRRLVKCPVCREEIVMKTTIYW